MEMIQLIGLAALVLILGIVGILVVEKYRASLALIVVLINACLTSIPAIFVLTDGVLTEAFAVPHLPGTIIVKIDSLSAWFMLIINFTSINGILFGAGYLKAYNHLKTNIGMHWIFYILFHISMLWVCVFENGLAFVIAWELMSLSSLFLVIFEYQNKNTLKAGLNYMVQMHLSVALLTLGFIGLYSKTGSFNFSSLADLPVAGPSIWIFLLLFIGFAIKAGFIPFHTWLPHAHPAAPSHVSGVMSGIIVKLGIYGIIRIITYLQHDWIIIGKVVLGLSIITALYGIANAALKYDFKRMLAFCTIENVGIIGIGIGLGLMGIGNGNAKMALLGFSAALLHTLNHSLFKSLLFFSAGSIYLQTHTRNIERLGGLINRMPATAIFFLIGAVAIGGLPPLNGFVSEYLIYSGLFKGITHASGVSNAVLFVMTIAGLAFIGGMSIFTFTKTFGVVFLGSPRRILHKKPTETPFIMHLPQYIIVFAMLSVAFAPQFYFTQSAKIVMSVFSLEPINHSASMMPTGENMATIGVVNILFIVLLFSIFGLRRGLLRNRETSESETWGCGYIVPIAKAQYTGRSFARSFGELFSFFVKEHKIYKKIPKAQLYPGNRTFSTYYFDLLEKFVVAPLSRRIAFIPNYFQFIQNGRIQSYVLYGLFFILLIFLGSILKLID